MTPAEYLQETRDQLQALIAAWEAGSLTPQQAMTGNLALLRRITRLLIHVAGQRRYQIRFATPDAGGGPPTFRTLTLSAEDDAEAWQQAAARQAAGEYVRSVEALADPEAL